MTPELKPPFEPDLFGLVETYAGILATGEIDLDDAIERDSPLLSFCHELYRQFIFSKYQREVTSFDDQTQRFIAETRIDLEAKPEYSKAERDLLALGEELCDLRPDIPMMAYPGRNLEFLEFHTEFVPRLLETIAQWTRESGLPELAERALRAQTNYTEAVGGLL